jgi:hypothetical protein
MLFWLPEDDLAETRDSFAGLNSGWDVPKPFFTEVVQAAVVSVKIISGLGSQARRKISVHWRK